MFGWLMLLPLMFVVMLVVGVFGLVFGLILLPFRLLGFVFKVLGMVLGLVIAAPLLLVATLVGGVGLAVAVGVVMLPLLPFLALGALVWWWLKPRSPAEPGASGATVVG